MIDHASQLLPVRNQGAKRGTCLAFAASTVHEHARGRRRGTACAVLSVESLYWHCKQIDGTVSEGTSFPSARKAIKDSGQCEEHHWPYDPYLDATSGYGRPAAAIAAANMRRASMTAVGTYEQEICDALRDGHVILAGFELWEGFYECRSADLPAPSGDIDSGALHAVCLVGLDEQRKLVKVRNSWGQIWGEDGYAWMALAGLQDSLLEAWKVEDDVDDEDPVGA
jgi:C1A family cysteine protease